MKTLSLMLLFLAVAAPTREAVAEVDAGTTQTRSPSADPPASDKVPVEHWTASLRASVQRQCQTALSDESTCACFTHELEALSADSDVVTSDNMQVALARCREM
jgi:hypothetical protein